MSERYSGETALVNGAFARRTPGRDARRPGPRAPPSGPIAGRCAPARRRRRRRRCGEVAALEQRDEHVGDLSRAALAVRPVPLVEPVAHAEQAEDDEPRRQVAQQAGLDALADHPRDGLVVLALGPGRARRHGRRQPALLAEEHRQEGQVLGQQRDLIVDDAPQGVVGGAPLGNDLAQPLLEPVDDPFHDEAEQLLLAGDVAVEGDLGQARSLGDRVERGRAVADLAEGGGGGPDDLVQDRRAGRGQGGVP